MCPLRHYERREWGFKRQFCAIMIGSIALALLSGCRRESQPTPEAIYTKIEKELHCG